MWLTSTGKLWDEIQSMNPTFTRSEIKTEMFSTLFYLKRTRIYSQQVLAKAFQREFPTVTKIIQYYKKTYQVQCQEEGLNVFKGGQLKDKIQLAHKMMQLESNIFTESLKTLFKNKNFYGIGIHDAIAVLDCSAITSESVIKVLKDKYEGIGLTPTFSVECRK
jgi:hypothetical protein